MTEDRRRQILGAQTCADLVRVLDEQPPPSGGTGDVLADLAAEPEPTRNFTALVSYELARDAYNDRGWRGVERVVAGLALFLVHQATECGWTDLLLERRAKGIATYGQPLRYGDGRSIVDAVEEALDLVAYLRREGGQR